MKNIFVLQMKHMLKLDVIINFRWKLLNLMAVKT